jgi:pimeloyl-ACP methyl ester carboxylesterase
MTSATATALWRSVDLPGRGSTFACDLPGPSPDAPTVVMLHGLSATGALNWGPSLQLLNEDFRVIALDHRGHGRGIEAGEPFTLEDCADDAVALADALGVGQAIFVGYSMGGPIAQLVWHRHPERVQGLVLCATAADFRPGADRWVVMRALEEVHRSTRLIPRPVRQQAARALLAGFVVDRALQQELLDALDRHDPGAVQQAARSVLRFSSTEWIDGVSIPTAVVVTERDRVVLPAKQRDLAARIPAAEVVQVDGNHMVFLSRPDVLAAAVREACRLVSVSLPTGPPTPTRRWWRWRRPSQRATRSGGARGWRRRRRARA